MFKRTHADNDQEEGGRSGIRYLYWGLTGAGFGWSSRAARGNVGTTPQETPAPPIPEYNLVDETPASTPDPDSPQPPEAAPMGERPEQIIARLTAERDAARYERELEADYREALLRDLDVMSRQMNETQRRLMELEQPAESGDPGEREGRLERELEEARVRIAQLESLVSLVPPAPLAREQEGMMDVFLQFVGLHERHGKTSQ